MKKILWLLAIISVIVALPAAEATFRLQSTGNGFFNMNGPTSVSYYGSTSSIVGGWDSQQIALSSGSKFGGIAVNMQRPTYVQQHTFDNANQNYRTVEYGDWQVRQIHANHKPSQSAFSYGNTPAGPQINGYIGGYRGVNPQATYARGLSNYDRRYNTHMFNSPYTASYQQPATLSARTAPRAYW